MSKTFNIFLVFAILFGPIIVLSQGYYNRYDYRRKRHEFTLGGGASNFLGELGGRDMVGSGFIYDLEFKETSYVGEFSYSYYALSKFSIRPPPVICAADEIRFFLVKFKISSE